MCLCGEENSRLQMPQRGQQTGPYQVILRQLLFTIGANDPCFQVNKPSGIEIITWVAYGIRVVCT